MMACPLRNITVGIALVQEIKIKLLRRREMQFSCRPACFNFTGYFSIIQAPAFDNRAVFRFISNAICEARIR